MEIRMLKSTVCGGKKAAAGAVVDASATDARQLINAGKAEEYTAPKIKRRKKSPPVNRMIDENELDNRGTS